MTTQSKALSTETPEAPLSNGWEKLWLLLDPVVVAALDEETIWKKLDRRLVFWLTNTAAKFPWLNHLALAGAVYSTSGPIDTLGTLTSVNSFLRWTIPEHCPSLSTLQPVEALAAYFGDPPHHRADVACCAYASLQLHMQHYLGSLSGEKRTELAAFLFPILVNTPKLSQLRARAISRGQAKRKDQAFAVVRDLQALVVMGRRRYQWLVNLDAQVQQVAGLVKTQQIILPAVIKCQDLDNRQELMFRVWDWKSWIGAHQNTYHKRYCSLVLHQPTQTNALFLQLVGTLPSTPWFLRAADLGALGREGNNAEARQYRQTWKVPTLARAGNGLILPNKHFAWRLARARGKTAGTPEDSRVLFCVESLLAGAAMGLFALVCLTQSGMRIGELQQVSGDKNCMKIGLFPQFNNDLADFSNRSTKLFFWQLYPKGGGAERQSYPVTPYMQEALKIWMEIHDRFCGKFKEVLPTKESFTHARRFAGRHLFVLQWHGKHLSRNVIEACLDLLLLEHKCVDSSGNPTRITSHVLRHGVAGYLRKQGVPLEDIANLLHQVNIAVTDYYSKLSPQDLYAKVGPLLTRLGELAEIDPATLRTVGDIQKLGQEALKRFGILRHIPGGTCATFTACEVQFKCAGCPDYIPDPARRDEVREKIASCARTTQFLEKSGDHLQAEVQQAHGRNWERIAKEMDALAAVELASPPFESVLQEFGIKSLDELDEEWLLILKQRPLLSSGGQGSHV